MAGGYRPSAPQWEPPAPAAVLDSTFSRYQLPVAATGAQPIPIAYAYQTDRLTRVEVTNLENVVVFIGTASGDVQGPSALGSSCYELPGGATRVFYLAQAQKLYGAGAGAGARVTVAISEFPFQLV